MVIQQSGLPPFPPPLPPLPLLPGGAAPSGAGSDDAPLVDTTQTTEARLGRIEELLARGLVTREDLGMAVLLTPTVAVDAERSFEVSFTDLSGNPITFVHLSITEVDIAAPQLVNADDVRLRLFRQGTRRVPQDLVAEFTGSSLISGTWQASFVNRRIEYTDLTGESKLYVAVRNTAANSGPSTFELRFYARVFPTRA